MAQQREQGAGHADHRADVGLELLAQRLGAPVEQRAHGAIAGVVDQDVEATLLHLQCLGQAGQGFAIVDVQLPGDEACAGQALDVRWLARRRPDLVACVAKRIGQGAADAAGTTGDQNGGHEQDLARTGIEGAVDRFEHRNVQRRGQA